MKKIWVLGDAVVDLLPDGEGKLLQCPGGAPANVAVGVARLGGRAGLLAGWVTIPLGDLCERRSIRRRSTRIICISIYSIVLQPWW